MKHFTVSPKGRKGYLFSTHAYHYELNVDINGTFTEFDIYADNRQAAIVSATIIVQSDDIKKEIDVQNAKQQIKVAQRLLTNNNTEYTAEQITDYINRINTKYGVTTFNGVTNDNVIVETIQETPDQSYTAFNRSFSTHSEAEAYCIQSDFDPSYIESSAVSSLPLQLDLQLFASKSIPNESYTYKESKKIIIDTSRILYKLWGEYDGDLKQKQWIRKFKIESIIIDKVKNKISELDDLNCLPTAIYKFESDKQLSVIFEWNNGNIYEWRNEVEKEIMVINDCIWKNGLTSITR